MDKKTKLYIGIGLLGVAGFLYWKSTQPKANAVCPSYIDCMPMVDGTSMHPYCTNMPQECVGKTSKAV
jgi:hypothetical protein